MNRGDEEVNVLALTILSPAHADGPVIFCHFLLDLIDSPLVQIHNFVSAGVSRVYNLIPSVRAEHVEVFLFSGSYGEEDCYIIVL